MHVVATAGHVDHGKTSLVDALTGMRSDRLPEERRREVSIELGYVWTDLDALGDVAFVDVPGHERYIATSISGLAPVRTAVLVAAADDPWMPQAEEHLAALLAFGLTGAVVAITKCDLADPRHLRRDIARRLSDTSLANAPIVEVSARTGQGLDAVRSELAGVLLAAPAPPAGADVRLWIDRRFVVKGRGVVVTGTLEAGTISAGGVLQHGTNTVRVRAVHSLGRDVGRVVGPARVALNLSKGAADVRPGDALFATGAWTMSSTADVRLAEPQTVVPRSAMLHVGTRAMQVSVRRLDETHLRLELPQPVPLRPGDRAVLRQPGTRSLVTVTILDPLPPAPSGRRGWARERAADVGKIPAGSSLESELDRRGWITLEMLRALGFAHPTPPPGSIEAPGFLVGAAHVSEARGAVSGFVTSLAARGLEPDAQVVARTLNLPSVDVLRAVAAPHFEIVGGILKTSANSPHLRELEDRLAEWAARKQTHRFHLDRQALLALGAGPGEVEALVQAGFLYKAAEDVFLAPAGLAQALDRLRALDEPWAVSDARIALGLSRAATMQLLHHLEQGGHVLRDRDNRRSCIE